MHAMELRTVCNALLVQLRLRARQHVLCAAPGTGQVLRALDAPLVRKALSLLQAVALNRIVVHGANALLAKVKQRLEHRQRIASAHHV